MTTSITFHLRPSQAAGSQTGKLFIRVIRNRLSKHISRNYALFVHEWDNEKRRVILPPIGGYTDGNSVRNSGTFFSGKSEVVSDADSARIHYLTLIDEAIKNDLRRLKEIVLLLDQGGDYTASDVAERFVNSLNGSTVRGYAEIAAARLRESGQDRTARAYRSAARSLTNFSGGKEVRLSEIDTPLMAAYEQHLLAKGLKLNTISFYLRNLRAMYFRAIAEKIIPRQTINPFAGMHTGVYETKRRALDDKQLQSLAQLDEILSTKADQGNADTTAKVAADPPDTAANAAVDPPDTARRKRHKAFELHDSLLLFLFCYHARGMSFVDMAHLRWENIDGDILTYRRRKTGGMLEVKVTDQMRKILSHFTLRTQESEFVFPVIDSRKLHIHRQYEAGLKRQNRSLKVLARMAGISGSLSTHAARHTWATLAKRLHVPVAVIGEALGHRDVKTTSIYLASFDRATMDELSTRLSDAVKAA